MSIERSEEDIKQTKGFLQKVGLRQWIRDWIGRMDLGVWYFYPSRGLQLYILNAADGKRAIVEIDERSGEAVARVYVAVGDPGEGSFKAAERMLKDGVVDESRYNPGTKG